MSEARRTVIAVASGKGGTGKTTVAAHLSLAAARLRKTILVDLDVEAPDALGYFPDAQPSGAPLSVTVPVPLVDEARCSGCGLCARTCRFGAIVAIGGVVTVDERVCKGCGRCVAACPSSALRERPVEAGEARAFEAAGLSILEGRMAVGDIRSTAVIEESKRAAAAIPAELEIRDCPPGVSCPATHAIEGADVVVLVAEPTEFSLHDLGAAAELARGQGLPVGVVVNKDGFGSADVDAFCASRSLPIIGRIAFLRSRAESGAATRLWSEDRSLMREMDTILARAFKAGKAGDAE